jgi:hypothetical protein
MRSEGLALRGRSSAWALALVGLVALALTLSSPWARAHSLAGLWALLQLASLVRIAQRVRAGALLDPSVGLGATYFVLLCLGAWLFELLRESPLSPYVQNAIGAGHAALWIGLELGAGAATRVRSPARGFTSRHAAWLVFFLLLVCLGATAALFALFGGVPLFSSDPDEARIAILSGRGELGTFLVGLTVVSLALRYDALVRGSRARRRVAHLVGLAAFLVLLSLGGRARALLFVLGYVGLGRLLVPRRIGLAPLALGVLGVLGLLGVVGAWRRSASVEPDAVVAELGIGTLALPSMLARIERTLSPGELERGLLGDLATLRPGADTGANVELKYAVFENWRAMPESAGVNPSLPGEAYLSYGSPGIVAELFLAGWLAAALYRRLASAPGFFATLAYVFVLTSLMGALSSGLAIRLPMLLQQLAWSGLVALAFLRRPRALDWCIPEARSLVSDGR